MSKSEDQKRLLRPTATYSPTAMRHFKGVEKFQNKRVIFSAELKTSFARVKTSYLTLSPFSSILLRKSLRAGGPHARQPYFTCTNAGLR